MRCLDCTACRINKGTRAARALINPASIISFNYVKPAAADKLKLVKAVGKQWARHCYKAIALHFALVNLMDVAASVIIKPLRKHCKGNSIHLLHPLGLEFLNRSMEHENPEARLLLKAVKQQLPVIMLVQHPLLAANPNNFRTCFFVNCEFKLQPPIIAAAAPHYVCEKPGVLQNVQHCLACWRKIVAAGNNVNRQAPVGKLLKLARDFLEAVNRRQRRVKKIARYENKIN